MEIAVRKLSRHTEVRISGRLDAQWAGDLDSGLAAAIRDGARTVRLDMSGITFMSSAGIRILIKYWKELKAIKGSFGIVAPSEQVRTVLSMAGLLDLLSEDENAPAESGATGSAETGPAAAGPGPSPLLEGVRLDVLPPKAGCALTLRISGTPGDFGSTPCAAKDLETLSATDSTMAFGLGAFGTGFDECRDYFGEFLVAGGAAVCIPATASRVPDFMVSTGNFVPTVQTLRAAVCRGDFSRFFQFDSESRDNPPGLSDIAATAASLCGPGPCALVMLAETAGLVGVHLAKSPLDADVASAWKFPDIRDWFSLTSEPAWPHSLALVTGIVADGTDEDLRDFTRPFGLPGKTGHFHAAALSYRALPEGTIAISIIRELFETQSLLGVLHLINDNRAFSGIGQSRFLRGAVWAGKPEIIRKGGVS